MTPEDLIQLAGNLAVNPRLGNGEARFRSAVSRAYYGAYHLAVHLLQEFKVEVRRNHTGHTLVYRCLFNCGHPTARVIAQLLDELRTERNAADYDLTEEKFADQRVAEDCVKKAHAIGSAISVCRQPQERASLEQGMQAVKSRLGL